MDESRKPGDATPDRDSWPKDEGSADNLSATGVFGAVSGPEFNTGQEESPAEGGDSPETPPSIGTVVHLKSIQEPVVHKVALASGSAPPPIDLLERLRTPSPLAQWHGGVGQAATPTVTGLVAGAISSSALSPVPSAEPSPLPGHIQGQSSEGFTQLIRALTGEMSSHASDVPSDSAERPAAASGPPASSPESEFTSLLRTLNPDDRGKQGETRSDPTILVSDTPPSDRTRGFTALLQGISGTDPDPAEVQSRSKPGYQIPNESGPSPPQGTPPFTPAPAPAQSEPGTLTRFFSALLLEGTDGTVAAPTTLASGVANFPTNYSVHKPVTLPNSEQSSFTQLISAIGEDTWAASPYEEDPRSVLQDFSRGRTPVRDDPLASPQRQTEVSSWMNAEPIPPKSEASLAGGAGLTQLLRTLDEPAKSPESPSQYPSRDGSFTPSNAWSAGSLTPTYRVDNPTVPFSPESPPKSPPAVTQWEPLPPAGAAPISSSGLSEVTRLLDMSKMREMQRQGMSSPAGGPAAQPLPQPVTQPPQVQPPNVQWPPQPQVPAPGMPQFQPAIQIPPYAQPARMPQMPAPPVAPPAALFAAGKMQQYLPLFAIIIIFLLAVILVTMVFLIRH